MTNSRFNVSFCFAPRCCVCEMALAAICPPFQTCMIHHRIRIRTSLLYQMFGWLSNIPLKLQKGQSICCFIMWVIRNLLNVFIFPPRMEWILSSMQKRYSLKLPNGYSHMHHVQGSNVDVLVRSLFIPVIVFDEFCSKRLVLSTIFQ